jgi:hydrogenase maturation protease
MTSSRTLLVGIGSPHGDDQAGWQIADRLAAGLSNDDIVIRKAASPAALLDWLEEHVERLIICDACRGLGALGESHRWSWPAEELMAASWSGTHNISLPSVLQLAERLGRLPPTVVIWSMEGRIGDALANMSPEVSSALPRLVDEIRNDLP